jgi:hypothetical protein
MPRTHNATGRSRKNTGSINAAPGRSTTRYKRRNKISEQFSPRVRSMLESPAYRVLSLSGHRILSRIEIEHSIHSGRDNGHLPCRYDDFEEYGVDRHSIAPAIREVCALGFVEITRQGRAGNREYRLPHLFRLTFIPTANAPATDEWRRIETIEEAQRIARAARATPAHTARRRTQRSKPQRYPRRGSSADLPL